MHERVVDEHKKDNLA